MASNSTHNEFHVFMLLGIMVTFMVATCNASFFQDFDLTWGDNRAKIFNGGQLLSLSLDKVSGSGFKSKNEYLFGRIDMQLKLVAGNSAGTVTAYYVSFCIYTPIFIMLRTLINTIIELYSFNRLCLNVLARLLANSNVDFSWIKRDYYCPTFIL